MKYPMDEALAEILRRGASIADRRNRMACRALTGAAGALLAALILAITFAPGGVPANRTRSVYGSFLLSQEAGGYVLAAVIAFVLGIAMTLCIVNRRNRS